MVPGHHYNWRRGEFRLVSPLDGLKTFYKQLIAGDGTDNIPSYDGKVRQSIPKFIEKLQEPIDHMSDELDMYYYVKDVYTNFSDLEIEDQEFCNKELHRNAQLLYILREEGKFWKPPGQKDELEVSS